MKRGLFLLIAFNLIFLLGCQNEVLLDGSELDMSKLGENEKYVVAKTIYKDLEKGAEYVFAEYEYDQYGNKIKKINYSGNDNSKYTIKKWEYDSKGNLLEYIVDSRKSDAYLKTYVKYEYKYNNQGKKIKETKKNRHDEILKEINFQYWPNKNLRSKITKFNSGNIIEIFYDKLGDPKKGIVFTNDGIQGNIKYQVEYYDDGKKKIQKNIIYKGKIIKSKTEYYNKQKKKIKVLDRKRKKINGWYEWEYNNQGKKTKFVVKNKKGKIKKYTKYKYDNNGNKTRYEKNYIENGEIDSSGYTKYKYDGDGNLLLIKWMSRNDEIEAILKEKFKKINIKSEGRK